MRGSFPGKRVSDACTEGEMFSEFSEIFACTSGLAQKSTYRTIQLDKRVFIKDSSVRCVFSPRSVYIRWRRARVSCWSLALHCFSSSAIRFPCSSSILEYEKSCKKKAACQLREHFFFSKTRRQFVIRDKNEKENTVDVYILRRYYVVCASICECICATARANTET